MTSLACGASAVQQERNMDVERRAARRNIPPPFGCGG